MAAFFLDLPAIEDRSALADWFELLLFRSGRKQLSRAQIIDALVAQLGVSAIELDAPVGFLFQEFSRRRRISGLGYPFVVVDNRIVSVDPAAKSDFYRFLLLISLDGPMRTGARFSEVDRLFDDVVGEAVSAYLGHGTRTIRFGWPVSGSRPKKFEKAVEWLSTETGIPVGSGVLRSASKDGGLDVIAWKPFKDQRTAFAIALVQCTLQRDWFPKGKDIIDDIWKARLDSGRSVLTSLALPFVIPRTFAKWDDLRRTVSIVLDRLRLAELLTNADSSTHLAMLAWNKAELAKYSA